jgi:hypothetical protein
MKKVVQSIVTNAIPIEGVKINAYYGVKVNSIVSSPNNKGFITRRQYGSGLYTVMAAGGLTYGNGWELWDSMSLQGLILTILSSNTREVFQFDTFQELFAWLAEK